ncbi:DUF4435 domain-containing protein [Roseovarius tibetensis]|uniref:DUF4435 domain-containing protein n=1 Tax=Roseovarius tibetensis TaxID=2685897 RepID=UPI003D7F8E7D
MSTSVVYPAKSAPALGFLKSSQNDIEVFVEDTAAPNTWVKLLRRYLPACTRLNSVSTLGGRDNVIAACRADQVEDGRRKLYIIDGDLDLLSGRAKPRLKHLYRLRAYCVENYLLSEEGLITVATTFDEHIDEKTAKASINLASWLNRNQPCLADLFLCYGACQEFRLSIKTVSYSAYLLKDDTKATPYFCPEKTRLRVIYTIRQLRVVATFTELRSWFHNANQRYQSLGTVRAVSAKDYLLPFIYDFMKHRFKVNLPKQAFRSMLAANADISFDPYLKRRLNQL